MWLKKLLVPFSNKTKEIDAVQLWAVRWLSRYNEYSSAVRPEMEAFTSEEEANNFAESLRNAFKLVRYTGPNTDVVVEKM